MTKQERNKQIIDMYTNGRTLREIKYKLNIRADSTIYNVLSQNNIPKRTSKASKASKIAKPKVQVQQKPKSPVEHLIAHYEKQILELKERIAVLEPWR